MQYLRHGAYNMKKKITFIESLLKQMFSSSSVEKSDKNLKDYVPREYLYLIYRF